MLPPTVEGVVVREQKRHFRINIWGRRLLWLVLFVLDKDRILKDKRYSTIQFLNNFNMEIQQLKPWQQDAMDKIRYQGNKELMWIFDFDGNSGKTKLGHHLVFFEGVQSLPNCKCHTKILFNFSTKTIFHKLFY